MQKKFEFTPTPSNPPLRQGGGHPLFQYMEGGGQAGAGLPNTMCDLPAARMGCGDAWGRCAALGSAPAAGAGAAPAAVAGTPAAGAPGLPGYGRSRRSSVSFTSRCSSSAAAKCRQRTGGGKVEPGIKAGQLQGGGEGEGEDFAFLPPAPLSRKGKKKQGKAPA